MNNTIEFCIFELVHTSNFSLHWQFLFFIVFWTNLPEKGYFQPRTEKSHLCARPWSLLTILNFKLFHTIADRHNIILMSLLLLVSETISKVKSMEKKLYLYTRILESLAGCRTMFLFVVFCKMGALERNAYWFHVKLIFIIIFSQSFKLDVKA